MRLDQYLVKNNYVNSRNKSINLIEKGFVLVNDVKCIKKNYEVNDNDNVKVIDELAYVSRAGYKLAYANEQFLVNFNNKVVVDLGASTGGFSDYCLQNNAKKVYCVDVGTNQLDPKLKNDNRVINLEKTNIKNLSNDMISEPIDVVVSDLSFISSKFMFEVLNKLNLSDQFNLISLIKPQFELDKNIVKIKKGYISKQYHQIAIDRVCKYATDNGFAVKKIVPSSILGAKKNNQEFLMWATKND